MVGAAACEGDDVVDGVGSGFAAYVACVGVAEYAGAEVAPCGGVFGSLLWGGHCFPSGMGAMARALVRRQSLVDPLRWFIVW